MGVTSYPASLWFSKFQTFKLPIEACPTPKRYILSPIVAHLWDVQALMPAEGTFYITFCLVKPRLFDDTSKLVKAF